MPFEINWTPIIVGIVAFFVGYLFAVLDQRVTASMRSRKEEKKGEGDVKVRVVERVVPAPSALRVVEKETGVQVFLDDAIIEPTTITALQRKRLIALLSHFRPFVDRKAAAPAPQSPPPRPEPPPAPPPVAADVAATNATDASSPPSIISQIDDILQAKLAVSPLSGRGIRLVEALDGSAHIWVGQQLYKAVDEIPEPAIQAIIREAIAEWERRSTPGP